MMITELGLDWTGLEGETEMGLGKLGTELKWDGSNDASGNSPT